MSPRSGSPPLFAARSPVVEMRAVFPLTVGEDGMAILPGEVRWALGLNPGDLLLVEWDEGTRERLTFRSYAARLRSAVESFDRPWPWVEESLELPMAAVAPGGGLMLPKVGVILLGDRPGIRQTLRAWVQAGERWFTVQRADARHVPEKISLEARHVLPIEPGCRVTLPADVLWALSLKAGDALVCKTWLGATAQLWAVAGLSAGSPHLEKRAGDGLVKVEPGGKLTLPVALHLSARPGVLLTLEVILSPYEESLHLDLRDLA